jgi:hypothetical protein
MKSEMRQHGAISTATDTVDERRKRDMCAVDVVVAFNGDFSGSADGPSVSHKP